MSCHPPIPDGRSSLLYSPMDSDFPHQIFSRGTSPPPSSSPLSSCRSLMDIDDSFAEGIYDFETEDQPPIDINFAEDVDGFRTEDQPPIYHIPGSLPHEVRSLPSQ